MNKRLFSFALLLSYAVTNTQAGVITNRNNDDLITIHAKPALIKLDDEFAGRCQDKSAPCGCEDVKRIEIIQNTYVEITEHVCSASVRRIEPPGLVCQQELRYRSVNDEIMAYRAGKDEIIGHRSVNDEIPAIVIKTGCELRYIPK